MEVAPGVSLTQSPVVCRSLRALLEILLETNLPGASANILQPFPNSRFLGLVRSTPVLGFYLVPGPFSRFLILFFIFEDGDKRKE